jgi:uncharacterized protein GlcG (DUF336 family)
MPAKGLAGPWYYEGDLDDHAWLRVGLGGLFNTAGLVSMGPPQTVPTDSFGFTQRMRARYGTHDRIALTPASTFAHGQRWDGEARCVLWAEGTVRQEIAYGEHLVLERRYEVELGSSLVRIADSVVNEGWFPTPHQLLYHFNLGFPLLGDGAEVIASTTGDPIDLSFSTAEGSVPVPSRWRTVTDPVAGFTHEGYIVPMRPSPDGWVSVALVNRRIRPETGGLGVYLRYDARSLPVYVAWRMMREGLYAIGLEPSTTPFGSTSELIDQGYPLMLAPGERRTYGLEFGILTMAPAGTFLELARRIVDAGIGYAEDRGLRMTLVVMDGTGTVCAAARMDGSRPITYAIAVAKANTARVFLASTADLAARVKPENKIAIGQLGTDIAFLGGGLPIDREGVVVGALGASGGNEEQDVECAQAALAAATAV